ncbi:13271_t:CDS:2 [Acaulospora colombiana]|uniref:13271_t:CDS:1 n=1 Tax=Acaulospora colombiana TaxID=27376 RepID=A0ACA9MMT6_9GLOM|nr:13271_t:CDS:2 [Acaulospora colombiana]
MFTADQLSDRVTKLEQKQTQDDWVHVLEDSILHEAPFNISSNIHAHSSEPKSSENKEIDEFLDPKNKEGVSGEIKQRNREKKADPGT